MSFEFFMRSRRFTRQLCIIVALLSTLFTHSLFAVLGNVTLNFTDAKNQSLSIATLRLDTNETVSNNNSDQRGGLLLESGSRHTIIATDVNGNTLEGTFTVPNGTGPHKIKVRMTPFISVTSTSGEKFNNSLRFRISDYLSYNTYFFDAETNLNVNQSPNAPLIFSTQWTIPGAIGLQIAGLSDANKSAAVTNETDYLQVTGQNRFDYFEKGSSYGLNLGIAYTNTNAETALGTFDYGRELGAGFDISGYLHYAGKSKNQDGQTNNANTAIDAYSFALSTIDYNNHWLFKDLRSTGVAEFKGTKFSQDYLAKNYSSFQLNWTGATLSAGYINNYQPLRGPQGTLFGRQSTGNGSALLGLRLTPYILGKKYLNILYEDYDEFLDFVFVDEQDFMDWVQSRWTWGDPPQTYIDLDSRFDDEIDLMEWVLDEADAEVFGSTTGFFLLGALFPNNPLNQIPSWSTNFLNNKASNRLQFALQGSLGEADRQYLNDQFSTADIRPNQLTYKLNDRISAVSLNQEWVANDPPFQFNVGVDLANNIAKYFGPRFEYAYTRRIFARHPEKTGKAPDAKAVLKKLPNDGFFHSKGSWGQGFDDQWGLKSIGFKATGRTGKGALWPKKATPVVVAVVDTGIDFGHPDLYGSLWMNVKDQPNDRKDNDNNQHTDDFIGWNFVNDTNNTRDNNGHGTFVAGIIAATTDNGLGISGINPWARIMPVKVADFAGNSNSVDVAQGIAYAAHMGARVINVSIGGRTLTRIEQAAVKEAAKAGALVVVAAGNEAKDVKDYSPAGIDGVITVAATDHNNQRANYSNWGTMVDIAAPGSDILSLRAIQTDLMQFEDKDYQKGANIIGSYRHYYHLSGTSFSAPYVSGVASLLMSLNPKLSAQQVKRMILNSAKDIETPGIDQFSGYGLLDATAALAADPAFFIETRISTVSVVQKDGKPYVRVAGTANADQLKRSWIELGKGDDPTQWKKVSGNINKAVEGGPIDDLNAANFAGSKTWIIRVITEHKNGKKREARFALKLG